MRYKSLVMLHLKIGLEMKAHEATIYAKTDSLPLPYAEEEIILKAYKQLN